jgi:acetolactate synthase I/II/III large subunit
MKTTVREAIVDIFKAEGISRVFGHTGGHIMLLWDAIEKAGIEPIFNKQEGNGVYMADCYARLSGLPSIVLGTSGPGIQNTLTGLASAYLDSIPIVAIGAGVPTFAAGRNALQESSGRGRATDQLMMFKGCTKQAVLVQTPASVAGVIREAFRVCKTGRPGPVYIEMPSDFWDIEIDYTRIEPSRYQNTNIPSCDIADSEAIKEALFKAERPAVVVGDGALEKDIGKKFMEFIETVKIPFYCSPKAKNFVDE